MADVGLNINISANVVEAVRALGGLNDNLVELATEGTGSIESVSLALNDLRNAAKNAGNPAELGIFNRAIKDLSVEANNLRKVGLPDAINQVKPAASGAGDSMTTLGLKTGQARVAFLDIGRAITGQGFTLRSLASNFALLGPAATVGVAAIYGLYEVLTKQTDAEKKADDAAKKLKETLLDLKTGTDISTQAQGSEAGNIARVQALSAAIQDTNNKYSDRQRALEELQKTNKSYFGDLSLEASSLATLAQRVTAYSNALITEAIIKDQAAEIAKVTEELLKQVHAEDALRDAQTRAQAAVDSYKPKPISAGDVASGGSNEGDEIFGNLNAATAAYKKQQDVVLALRTSVAEYNGELVKNIGLQISQKPLTPDKTDTAGLDGLLQKIIQIKTELAKPVESPIFKQFSAAANAGAGSDTAKLFAENIAKAIEEGAKLGTAQSRQYAAELAGLYQQELNKIRTPNLLSRVQGTVDVKSDPIDALQTQIEKAIGTKGLKFNVPLDITESIKAEGFNKQETETLLRKASEDALNGLPPIRWNAKIQLIVDQKSLQDSFKKQLTESLNKTITNDATSGLENIGKALGDSLAKGGNPLQAAGDAILSTIGGLMEDVGKALVKYGAEMLLVKDVLASGLDLAPGVAIAAGIAMIAAGELVKKSFKATAFADGGIVTGPTYGLVGEAGPEAIFPLSKINDFMSNVPGHGGEQNVNVTGTIRGQDLILINQRAQKNANLVGKPNT